MRSSTGALLIVAALAGAVLGIGGYTFLYAKGYSYLTDDPAACANCHVMNEQFRGWMKSSHRSAAMCNDCHTPANAVGKYAVKASNGFRHSFYFTTGWFPDNIRITAGSSSVVQENCRRCHRDIVDAIDGPHADASRTDCIFCHTSAGHME